MAPCAYEGLEIRRRRGKDRLVFIPEVAAVDDNVAFHKTLQ